MRVSSLAMALAALAACVPEPDDPSVAGSPTFDNDGDGYAESTDLGSRGGDCNDADGAIHPGATEVCDNIDNDCDGVVDILAADSTDGAVYYPDTDGDGAGDPKGEAVRACSQPAGYAANDNDCDDNDRDVIIRDWYVDGDSDGWGTGEAVQACEPPPGHTENPGDCDDSLGSVYPGRSEICADGLDNDCDGGDNIGDVLEGQQDWVVDGDNDGFGELGGVVVTSCEPPAGHVLASEATDCDDTDGNVNPAATEVCDDDDTDEDCDGLADDDDLPEDAPTWYIDDDDDLYGAVGTGLTTCEPQPDRVDNGDDCNDGDTLINPDTVWYADADGDTYGDAASSLRQCEQPATHVANDEDCDDTDNTLNPGTTWFQDVDGDDYGRPNGSVLQSCVQPAGFARTQDDCNDDDASQNPGSVWYADTDGDTYGSSDLGLALTQCEHPGAGYVSNDDDCDDADNAVLNARVWYDDADVDGHGDVGATGELECVSPNGPHSLSNDDCDDGNADINPSEPDLCNGVDDNCSGDEADAINAVPYYPDADGDGHGDADGEFRACSDPGNTVGNGGDCDDTNPDINPDEAEVCRNNLDDNCDGLATPCLMVGNHDGSADADLAFQQYSGAFNNNCPTRGIAVGDLNGDSAPDLLIGNGSESVVMFASAGFASGIQTWAGVDQTYTEEAADDLVGEGLAAGDINGDAYDDVLAEYISDVRGVEFHFWYGRDGFDFGTPNVVLTLDSYPSSGRDLLLDDMNGDTLADIIVGDHHHDSWRGGVYVYTQIPSSAVDLETNADVILFEGENQGDYIGGALDYVNQRGLMGKRTEVVEDFDGDGVPDMAFGAQFSGRAHTSGGAAYVMLGPFQQGATYSLADAEVIMDAQYDAHGLGVSLDSGDLDGDGLSDVAVGSLNIDASEDRAWVIHGTGTPRGTFSSSTAWIRLRGLDIGNGVAIGDFDGNGIDDLFTNGHRYTDPGSYGAGHLYYDGDIPAAGGLLQSQNSLGFTWDLHPNSGARYPGRRGPILEDIDNDGFDDLLISSPGRCQKFDDPSYIWNGVLVHKGGGW